MKRGTFVVFAILILIFSSVSVNADLVDWFTQDHAGSLSNENQITGLSFFGDFFNSIGNFFKKLLGQEQVGFAGSSGKSYDFNNDGCVDIGDEGFVFDINGDGNTQDDLIALQSNFETDCEPIGIETVTEPPVEQPSTLPPVENPPAAKVAETQACVPGTALTGDELLKNLDKAEPKGVIDLEDLIVFNAAPFDADGNGCVDLTQDGSVYAAKNGETYVIAGQQAFTCQGTASENAVLCANDDKDLTEQNSKLGNILVTGDTNHGCTNLRKCEYYCADNYEKQGTGENAKCAPKITPPSGKGSGKFTKEQLQKLDIDGSGKIDFEDFFAFAASFDKKPGDAEYDVRADFTKSSVCDSGYLVANGVVDLEDFFLFANAFDQDVNADAKITPDCVTGGVPSENHNPVIADSVKEIVVT